MDNCFSRFLTWAFVEYSLGTRKAKQKPAPHFETRYKSNYLSNCVCTPLGNTTAISLIF